MNEVLDALAGAFGTRNASARSTAAMLSNPGCQRRAVLDAARVDLVAVAEKLGAPAQFGQSPFAIGQGNRFEERIKVDGYRALASAINELLGIFDGVLQLQTVNLEHVPGHQGQRPIEARAAETADVLQAIAAGDEDAPHVVDHGVTTLKVGDDVVFLEQDALAFRVGEQLRICEVKGFPIIDGTASPTKVGAAARQTAVYVASIQDTLAARDFDPKLVSSEVVLICPRNFSIEPVAVLVDVDREVRALRRQLRRRTGIAELLDRIGGEATSRGADLISLASNAGADEAGAAELVQALPYRYVPECLSNCDLARHCRSCSVEADDPGRLGGDVAALIGNVATVAEALTLAGGAAPSPDDQEVAHALAAARAAFDEAMAHDS